MNKSSWQISRIIPAALVMGLIFCLSHQDGSTLSLPAIPYIDKLGHFCLYFLLAGTVLFALPVRLKKEHLNRTAVAVVLFCLIYGATDELHQAFIPGRDSSIADLGADFLGAAVLVFFWNLRQEAGRSSLPEPGLPEEAIPGVDQELSSSRPISLAK